MTSTRARPEGQNLLRASYGPLMIVRSHQDSPCVGEQEGEHCCVEVEGGSAVLVSHILHILGPAACPWMKVDFSKPFHGCRLGRQCTAPCKCTKNWSWTYCLTGDPLGVGRMQSCGLLEARRSAWQFCSTSRRGPCPAVSPHLKTISSLPANQLSVRKSRQRCRQNGPLSCKAQAPDTQERQAERSESSNGSNGSNGSYSNGNGSLQNGSSSNGSSPPSGNGASQNGDGSRPQTFSAYNDTSKRGTLDHMLDSSKQVFLAEFNASFVCNQLTHCTTL